MKWMIVTDSSCDLKTLEGQNEDLGFETVPFVMDVDGREFVDEPDLNVTELVDAMEKAAALMQNLRANTPDSLAGFPVDQVLDYQAGTVRTASDGAVKPLGLPSSNVMELSLSGAGRVIVRPSGTEPKVKFYFTAVAPERESAEARLGELAEEMKQFVPAD